ncbi:MAG: hypothetical protein GX897_00535 [Clostridiales bacterium]|nr:hypothetical protein [Clostridiales bacterium]
MDFSNTPKDHGELKKLFTNPSNEYKPIPFLILTGDISDEDDINSIINQLKRIGCGGCAILPSSDVFPAYDSDLYWKYYQTILEKLEKNALYAVYCDDVFPVHPISEEKTEIDPDIQTDPEGEKAEAAARINGEISGRAGGVFASESEEDRAHMLVMREYECVSEETVKRKLDDSGETMSIVAYDIDKHNFIDIRDKAFNGEIIWDVPEGNWSILQFICKPIPDCDCVNYLSYDSSQIFIDLTYKKFTEQFDEFVDETIAFTYFNGVQFFGPNRRMWDKSFNDVFMDEYGFDPAPFYPALYMDIGEHTAHFKALFFDCRAKMLENGFIKAVSDFTKTHRLISSGCVADLKTVQSVWLFGDGMRFQKQTGAAAVSLENGIGYGFNGLKLASGAADNFDRQIVICDIFGNYGDIDLDAMYNSAMTALARGANLLMPRNYNLSEPTNQLNQLTIFNDYLSRSQVLLRGGRHVCDIAVLYPLHSLEAQTSFFDLPATGFEYPQTPPDADYMGVINLITNYSIRDVTVIHPETLSERCYIDKNQLCLSNEINSQRFKAVVIPGTSMISVKNLRLLAKFFDQGGKIIATSKLPTLAFEFNPDLPDSGFDDEVKRLVKHIFGVTMEDVNTFADLYSNKNDNGGEAYFILPSLTGADGTEMVDKDSLDRIINGLDILPDVIFSGAPKVADNGVFSLPLPAFRALDYDSHIRKSGMVFNYIHKVTAGCDIYFVANATSRDFIGEIAFLQNKPVAEEWNPYNGRIRRLLSDELFRNDDGYARLDAEIPSGSSVFYVFREESKSPLSLNNLFKVLE